MLLGTNHRLLPVCELRIGKAVRRLAVLLDLHAHVLEELRYICVVFGTDLVELSPYRRSILHTHFGRHLYICAINFVSYNEFCDFCF